ncbi:hypothetical protein [Microbulbifer elongatus]|uniref:hypothetical protein n=1 Tax=Microbulbifer elongatus TaxID=86173 RepID=UPI001CFCC49D|nr:hypothetical protein [Microbulbifer elongatus]
MVLPLGLDLAGFVTAFVFVKQMASQAENDQGKNKYADYPEHGYYTSFCSFSAPLTTHFNVQVPLSRAGCE